MDKGMHSPFHLEGCTRNRQVLLPFTSIAAKIYNVLLCNRIKPKIEKILRKNQNGFRKNRSMSSQILTIRRILGVRVKTLKQQYYLSTSSRLWLHTQREDEAIITRRRSTQINCCSKNDAMYNTKVKVPPRGWRHRLFDIVAGVLQWDTLSPYLFIICLDYVLEHLLIKWKKTVSSWQRKEVEDTPRKLLGTRTTLMT